MGKRRKPKRTESAMRPLTKGMPEGASRQQRRREERRQEKQTRRGWPGLRFLTLFWRRALAGTAAVALVLGLAADMASLQAHISVSAGDTQDQSNPFATVFTVSNTGPIAAYNVEVDCGIGEINSGGKSTEPTPDWRTTRYSYKSRLDFGRNSRLGTLQPGDSSQSRGFCDFDARAVRYADIALVVSYRPKFWPWRREQTMRFVTQAKTGSGEMWVQVPVAPE